MNILVSIKRVPATGARILITDDGRHIETRNLGFTVSPHEECAVEEAVRQIEEHGGSATVLTLGPAEAEEQLRDALAVGIDNAILLETEGEEWEPLATASAIVDAVRVQQEAGNDYDILLFGNESADSGGYQVGVRVAHALDLPCLTGVKELRIEDGVALARREGPAGWELYEIPLPAVFSVKEGINLPRYPSLPGRLKAKKKAVERLAPAQRESGLQKVRLFNPPEDQNEVQVLGDGPSAAPRIVDILQELKLV